MNTQTNVSGELSVFLVDDDSLFLKSLAHHLQQKLKFNIRINAFPSGESCLEHLNEKPDIVVLDYLLNGEDRNAMNGVQVLEKIKSIQPDTSVIMLSGQDKMEVAIDSMKHGAFDYVIKNENAFLRAQNVIRNAVSALKMSQELKLYKRFLWITLFVLSLIFTASIVITTIYEKQLIH